MDNQNSGCGLILALMALGLVVAFWQVLLSGLLVVGVITLTIKLVAAHRYATLRSLVSAADQRFAGDVCRLDEHFAIVEQIRAEGSTAQPRIQILTARISKDGEDFTTTREQRSLMPPGDLNSLASNLAFSRLLQQNGIEMVNDLSVEAKAAKAAMTCIAELDWSRTAANKMNGLIRSAHGTLTKAQGNELLEPSIPQLNQALTAFRSEGQKLENYLDECSTMLRKLDDFLSVPAAIRPILSFDLDNLFDPSRFKELEASFKEVVTLNDVFRELSQDP